MRRRRFSKHLLKEIYAKSNGNCHHCNKMLPWIPGSPRVWHVDHHPVAFRDIADQVMFGITDPMDVSNLVASCRSCNVSHRFEKKNVFGRTQLPFKRKWVERTTFILIWVASVVMTFTLRKHA